MEYTKENLQELAESIYDLDAEVYAQLGSSLGRVFNRDREGCVSDMVQLMLRKDSHQLRSELALISNMARTIEDKGTRSMIMTEYNRIKGSNSASYQFCKWGYPGCESSRLKCTAV